MMDAVLKLGNANDIINRGWELRNLFFATQNSKLMFGGAVSLGGMATDPIGCGVLNELGKLPGDHLEIGTGLGAGSAWIVARSKTEGKICTIDADPDKTDVIRARLSMMDLDSLVEFSCATSARLPWPGPFVTAYIDGDHTKEWVLRDWANISPLITQYVMFDDVCPKFPGTIEAYTEIRQTPGWEEVFFLGRVGVLWKSR